MIRISHKDKGPYFLYAEISLIEWEDDQSNVMWKKSSRHSLLENLNIFLKIPEEYFRTLNQG